MKVSLSGLLRNSAAELSAAGRADSAYMLEQLLNHLAMVKADPSRLDEFFELYIQVPEPITNEDSNE